MNKLSVLGDVLADITVAAGFCTDHVRVVFARDIPVRRAHRKPVDLLLHGINGVLAELLREGSDFLVAENILDRQHRHLMRHFIERALDEPADVLRRRKRGDPIGVLLFRFLASLQVHRTYRAVKELTK